MEYDENRNLKSENYFNKLNRSRIFIQNNLKYEIELLTAYLIGDLDYFNRNLFESNKVISEMFDFENDLLILVELNKIFGFTEDNVFTPKTIAENIYNDYPENFESLKQLLFIEHKLKDIANQNHSFVVSLFFFFKKDIKIKTPSARIFQEIINNNFNHNFGKIKLSDPENLEHKKRIKKLHLEWH